MTQTRLFLCLIAATLLAGCAGRPSHRPLTQAYRYEIEDIGARAGDDFGLGDADAHYYPYVYASPWPGYVQRGSLPPGTRVFYSQGYRGSYESLLDPNGAWSESNSYFGDPLFYGTGSGSTLRIVPRGVVSHSSPAVRPAPVTPSAPAIRSMPGARPSAPPPAPRAVPAPRTTPRAVPGSHRAGTGRPTRREP